LDQWVPGNGPAPRGRINERASSMVEKTAVGNKKKIGVLGGGWGSDIWQADADEIGEETKQGSAICEVASFVEKVATLTTKSKGMCGRK